MTSASDRHHIDDLYASGVAAVGSVTAGYSDADWSRPACGHWTGTELAGHLVTVIGWYHDWLDRAEAGDARPAFPASALDNQTAAALAALPAGNGPDRIAEFTTRADAYRARLQTAWDLPFGYPRGTVTAGAHAAVEAWEWHVHAWDLATAVGGSWRPDDAETLYAAGLACIRLATGVELPEEPDDSWIALLRRTGRAVEA